MCQVPGVIQLLSSSYFLWTESSIPNFNWILSQFTFGTLPSWDCVPLIPHIRKQTLFGYLTFSEDEIDW